ncbi:hypothetical protein ACUOFC_42810, partial [Escherichia sp. TWPC-MK]
MIKQTIVALILSVGASSVFAAGTVKVFSNGSSEAKTLTGAEYLIDPVAVMPARLVGGDFFVQHANRGFI